MYVDAVVEVRIYDEDRLFSYKMRLIVKTVIQLNYLCNT
jgi:hypothetical protein